MSEHSGIKINLGCGEQKEEGWIGIDKADYGQQIVRDLRKGLPFCDNSVDEIKTESFLEHICDNDDFIFLMNECLRVLKPGCKMWGTVPYWRGGPAHKDPTHCRYFDPKTFSFFEPTNIWKYGIDKRWKVENVICRGSKDRGLETLEFHLIANK